MTLETQQDTPPEAAHQSSDYLNGFSPRLMDWDAAKVFASKNIKIAFRYPANFLIWGFLPILWFAPYILMANALTGTSSSVHFTELSGFNDFISFSVIGWFVYMYLDNSIWAIGNNFRWEQFSGTLEPLFIAPVSRISILLGAAFSNTIQAVIQTLVLLFTGIILFGVTYAITAIAPTAIILFLMVITLYGFGFMLAGLILVFKDPSVLSELISNSTFVLSPVNYPIQALPTSVQFVAYLIPTTIGIITIREIAITGVFDLFSFLSSVGGLGVLAVFFWILGLASFKYAEKWTKQRGSMGDF
ncbi:MAG: ABC transporter permease [Candidatus Thorarchaeota archaeon]